MNERKAAESRKEAKVFRYQTPEFEGTQAKVWLARSDIMFAAVKAIREGGENNLHSHTALDGFWFVLKGRARFYGEGDTLLGDLGPQEGIFLPRGTMYWFESAGDELLEILQVESIDKSVENRRNDHKARTAKMLVREDFESGK
jgi:mannose-6-phosphate isomerase-like protein (cupin superfamily)